MPPKLNTEQEEVRDFLIAFLRAMKEAFGSPQRVRIEGTRLEPCPALTTGLCAVGVSYSVVPAEKQS